MVIGPSFRISGNRILLRQQSTVRKSIKLVLKRILTRMVGIILNSKSFSRSLLKFILLAPPYPRKRKGLKPFLFNKNTCWRPLQCPRAPIFFPLQESRYGLLLSCLLFTFWYNFCIVKTDLEVCDLLVGWDKMVLFLPSESRRWDWSQKLYITPSLLRSWEDL